jgi:hypothetical protein
MPSQPAQAWSSERIEEQAECSHSIVRNKSEAYSQTSAVVPRKQEPSETGADRRAARATAPCNRLRCGDRTPAPLPIEAAHAYCNRRYLSVACRPGWWWSHIPSGEHRTEDRAIAEDT